MSHRDLVMRGSSTGRKLTAIIAKLVGVCASIPAFAFAFGVLFNLFTDLPLTARFGRYQFTTDTPDGMALAAILAILFGAFSYTMWATVPSKLTGESQAEVEE